MGLIAGRAGLYISAVGTGIEWVIGSWVTLFVEAEKTCTGVGYSLGGGKKGVATLFQRLPTSWGEEEPGFSSREGGARRGGGDLQGAS